MREPSPVVDLDPTIIRQVSGEQSHIEGGRMIRERMKVLPWGTVAEPSPSRFKAGLMAALGDPFARSLPSSKARRTEGELLGTATAVIADPTSSDADLRAAFLRVATVLEGEMLHGILLARRVRDLEAEVAQLRKQGA